MTAGEWIKRELERDMSFLLQLGEGMSSFSEEGRGKGFSLSGLEKLLVLLVLSYIFREFLE